MGPRSRAAWQLGVRPPRAPWCPAERPARAWLASPGITGLGEKERRDSRAAVGLATRLARPRGAPWEGPRVSWRSRLQAQPQTQHTRTVPFPVHRDTCSCHRWLVDLQLPLDLEPSHIQPSQSRPWRPSGRVACRCPSEVLLAAWGSRRVAPGALGFQPPVETQASPRPGPGSGLMGLEEPRGGLARPGFRFSLPLVHLVLSAHAWPPGHPAPLVDSRARSWLVLRPLPEETGMELLGSPAEDASRKSAPQQKWRLLWLCPGLSL